jgi:enoyl-[acyl-carrier protein] reductase I
MSGKLLDGKVGLIMGVANNMSIAWGIAEAAHAHGATLIFTYQGELLKKRVEPLAKQVGVKTILECDVLSDASVQSVFEKIQAEYGKLDFVVHSIAFSDKNELKGKYVETTEQNFLNTMNISCFSFVKICKYAKELMKAGGSILTLTYYGAEKVMPNYNVMGVAKAALEASVRYIASDLGESKIRVNAISAGPIKTLAASGISGLRSFLKMSEENSPLRSLVTQRDVGNAATFLVSDLSTAITGEIMYVDAGYNIIGMNLVNEC